MLKEQEISFDGHDYLLKQLPLGKSQDVLIRILRLVGGGEGVSDSALASLPSRLRNEDVNYLRENLLGEFCSVKNESGHWVPLGKALVETHFAGRIGAMFHLLGRTLLLNYSSFLADLRLEDLLAEAGLDE